MAVSRNLRAPYPFCKGDGKKGVMPQQRLGFASCRIGHNSSFAFASAKLRERG